MPRPITATVVAAVLMAAPVAAQTTQDEIFTVRSLNQDARVSRSSWIDASVYNFGYTGGSNTFVGATLGLVPSPRWELALALAYTSSSFTGGSSGLSDPHIHAKYNFAAGATRLSAGGFVTVPVGSEDVGEGDVDAGIFLAVRHPVGQKTTVGGRISGDYFEFSKDDRDPSMRVAGHVIQRMSDKVALVGEALLNTAGGTTAIDASGVVDVAVGPRTHLRGIAGVGLSNAADRLLGVSLVHHFR